MIRLIFPIFFIFFQSIYLDIFAQVSIIPQPDSIVYLEKTSLVFDSLYLSDSIPAKSIFNYLISDSSSDALPISLNNNEGNVFLRLNLNDSFPQDGYMLFINKDEIEVSASSENGLFYGVQSLKQIVLSSMLEHNLEEYIIPGLKVIDKPRFRYRGMHLDVSRHFFSIDFIKRYIDLLAYHKLNYFHWHLTDDQGWRIEIKKYPRLTSLGSIRGQTKIGHASDAQSGFDQKPYGGYYTQDEIKEVVDYAKQRFITIIPEIEMPGHALAALAAYPEFSCNGKALKVGTTWGVFEDVFCTKEEVFEFLEDILDEVIALFPGRYIHIGGDECPKTRWKSCSNCQQRLKNYGLKNEAELQSYFIRRIEKYLNSRAKTIIGWDEILEGGIAPNATVMSWRGVSGGIEAAESKHEVIMSPTSHCYFDYYQSMNDSEPLAIGGYTPLRKVYEFNPIPPELSKHAENYIIGAQANVWTEYIISDEQCEYMVFPRLCALAEVNWTNEVKKYWPDFLDRLNNHFQRLDFLNVNYANHLDDVEMNYFISNNEELIIQLNTALDKLSIYSYRSSDTIDSNSKLYSEELVLNANDTIHFYSYDENTNKSSDTNEVVFLKHLAFGKDISINPMPNKLYPGKLGKNTIVDGLRGSKRFNGSSYTGFYDAEVEIIIDLKSKQAIHEISIGSLQSEASWIYLPELIKLSYSDDGVSYFLISDNVSKSFGEENRLIKLDIKSFETRFVKIVLHPVNPIPPGFPGAGNTSWLFIDELIIR